MFTLKTIDIKEDNLPHRESFESLCVVNRSIEEEEGVVR